MATYSCDDIVARLDDYLDQELPPDQTHRLMDHLDACEACSALCRRSYREIAELRAAIQVVEPPVDLAQKIAARIRRVDERPP